MRLGLWPGKTRPKPTAEIDYNDNNNFLGLYYYGPARDWNYEVYDPGDIYPGQEGDSRERDNASTGIARSGIPGSDLPKYKTDREKNMTNPEHIKRTTKTKLVGLTGGAGSGKSTLAKIFQKRGAKIIDADRIGHQLLKPGSPCFAKVFKTFGREIVVKGKIDRKILGRIAFSDKRNLGKLNKITHPYILKQIKENISNIKKSGYRGIVIIDAALITQWGWKKRLNYIIMVNAPARVRLERMRIKGFASARAKSIMAQQLSPRQMRQTADWIIENRGSLTDLQEQALEAWQSIK